LGRQVNLPSRGERLTRAVFVKKSTCCTPAAVTAIGDLYPTGSSRALQTSTPVRLSKATIALPSGPRGVV
jgi:hypothetical protein